MTRAEAIEVLKKLIEAMQGHVTVLPTPERIAAIRLAIASLKTDEAYQLEYERTTKNDLGVDSISREQALRELKESAEHHANDSREEALLRRDRDIIRALPSVTPQEPQTFKWCTDCKEYDQEKHCCHRWSKAIRDTIEEMKQGYIERDVLDKIRDQLKSNLRGVEITLEVLVENDPLRPKMEGAKCTLEDCLELIDKAEAEG